MSRISLRLSPTKLSGSVLFLEVVAFLAGTGLDSSECAQQKFLLSVLTVEECWKNRTHHPKTEIVVAVGGRFVVAVGSATVRRIVVPRTAPFTDADPKLRSRKSRTLSDLSVKHEG